MFRQWVGDAEWIQAEVRYTPRPTDEICVNGCHLLCHCGLMLAMFDCLRSVWRLPFPTIIDKCLLTVCRHVACTFNYLVPYEYYILLCGTRCRCVVWTSATIAAAWLTQSSDYCAFLIERREPHGVPSPCGYSCTVCATVYLTVMPSLSDIFGVSAIGHSAQFSQKPHTSYFTSHSTERTLWAVN